MPDTCYHIYSWGINRTNIFIEHENYDFFLEKYSFYIFPIAETYAYCLLRNHFHILIRTRPEEEILKVINADRVLNPVSVNNFISRRFSHLFNSYTQAINKAYKRTGGLFETPFRRISVDNAAYFNELLCYIHFNPQKHGFVNDFRDYPYSSWGSFSSKKNSKLSREKVFDDFGGESQFFDSHEGINGLRLGGFVPDDIS